MGDRVMFDACTLEFTVPRGTELPEGLMDRFEQDLPGLLGPLRAWLATVHPQAEVEVRW